MKDRTLQDLTKEEIGTLFPIEISEYDDKWPVLYENEKRLILQTVEPGLISRIEHFGSTSVPGLSAKNTIDILMDVQFDEDNTKKLIEQMKVLLYDFNWQSEGSHRHMVFVKGYDINNPGMQTYHIHAGPADHPLWDRIVFRDYLINHPDIATAYEELKIKLAKDFRHDRVAYRVAKTEFVRSITEKAKQLKA